MASHTSHWVSSTDIDTTSFRGFVYMITNLITNKKYIGQKSFFKKNGKNNNWENYTSSSVELNDDINKLGSNRFNFTILELTDQLNETELLYQTKCNVLEAVLPDGQKAYYNKSICGKTFALADIDTIKRNKAIIHSRAQNKILLNATDICGTEYSYFNTINNEIFTGNIESFAIGNSVPIIDAIKLSLGIREMVKKWVLYSGTEKLSSPNLDKHLYKILNLSTGVRLAGTRSYLIREIKTSASAFSVALNHKKYIKGWVFCDNNWVSLTEIVDKRKTTGNNHHRADTNQYTIINISTNELYTGTRADIKKKLSIKTDLCHAFIHGNIKLCNKVWKIKENI